MSCGSVMFSAAVSVGTRLKDWNTKPIRSLRSLVSAPSLSPPTSTPSTVTVPEVGVSSAAMQCMRVDFPEPDGPMIAANSPRAKSRSTPARALTCASPVPYTLVRSRADATVALTEVLLTGVPICVVSLLGATAPANHLTPRQGPGGKPEVAPVAVPSTRSAAPAGRAGGTPPHAGHSAL